MSAPRRRTVIAGTAAAAAATTTGTVLAPSAQAAKAPVDLFARSRFSPLVGKTFSMTSSAGTFSAVLTAVDDLVPGGTPGSDKQFAATFSVKAPHDGTYTFSRSGFTATALFVVGGARGTHVRATVNRI